MLPNMRLFLSDCSIAGSNGPCGLIRKPGLGANAPSKRSIGISHKMRFSILRKKRMLQIGLATRGFTMMTRIPSKRPPHTSVMSWSPIHAVSKRLTPSFPTSDEIRKRQGLERTGDDRQADFPGAIVRAAVPVVRQDAWRNTGRFTSLSHCFTSSGTLMGIARKKRVVHVEKDGPHPFFTQIVNGVYRRNATEITIGSKQDNPNPYRCSAIAA